MKTTIPNFWRVDNTNRARSQYTFFIENGSRPCAVGKVAHKIGTAPQIVYCVHMNKTLLSDPQTLQDLQDFMFDTMASSEMAVDWFCEYFNVSATDEVIDFVLDAHDAFFGN